MNKNDFCYMLRGEHIGDLEKKDFLLLKPIAQTGKKHDRALLLIHGFSSTPAVYRQLIPLLKGYDAIFCPKLPGHAESIEAFSHVTAEDWLSFITQTCIELFAQYQKVDVVGLSLGGLLASKLSEQFAFNHLFLLAPALKLKMKIDLQLKLATLFQRLGFKELRGAAGNLITNNQAEISYKKLPLSTIMEMLKLVIQNCWIPPTVPTDLFLGRHDEVVDSEYLEKLFNKLPNVTIHWLENSAHVLPLDHDLEQIAVCINNTF